MERDRLDRRWLLAAAAAGIGVIGAGASMAGAGAASDRALHAHATLLDPAGAEIGGAKLTEDGAGRVHVNVKVDGLSPSLHGIHFHAVGACSPDFAAAGGHHNPLGAQHGSHAGDLPNLVVNVGTRTAQCHHRRRHVVEQRRRAVRRGRHRRHHPREPRRLRHAADWQQR